MADDVTFQIAALATPPNLTVVATDEIGGVHHQRVKNEWGPDGTANEVDVVIDKPLPVSPLPRTTGGCSVHHVVAAASTNAANIKASAGQVYGARVFNKAAYPIYLKLHNDAGIPTAGAGVVYTVGVQAGLSRDVEIPNGIAFATGIARTIVKDLADAGTTVIAAEDCVVDVEYK